jgi:hypothetical protein
MLAVLETLPKEEHATPMGLPLMSLTPQWLASDATCAATFTLKVKLGQNWLAGSVQIVLVTLCPTPKLKGWGMVHPAPDKPLEVIVTF